MKRLSVAGLGMGFILAIILSAPAYAGPLAKPVSKNPEAQKLIDQAWVQDHTDSTAQIYKQCMDLIEKADKLDPNNPAILTELSRYYWNYGDSLPKATKEQQKMLEGIYAQGLAAAEKSLALKEDAGNHYWLAVNRSSSLEFSSIFAQAAAFLAIKKHSDWVVDHDPSYYYGAPGRLWSEILVRVPKVVVEMVRWNVQESVDLINNAIKEEPRYLDNYCYKARFYWKYYGDKDEALKNLDYELKQDPNIMPGEVSANKVSQRDARELWKQITGKDYPKQ
jgi:tetratricopeptide (TPR) repeat protein